jgi:CBS domain-containing protein
MTPDFTLVSPGSSIELAAGIAAQTNAQSLPVGSFGIYSGLVTRDQIERAMSSGAADTTIGTIVTDSYEHVHPDHPLELVLYRLAKNPGLLPVVSRRQVNRIEGIITRRSVSKFLQSQFEGPTDRGDQRAVE